MYLDTKVVGPLVAAPAKPLPEELEECFFQRSGIKGVILVSFGTVLANRDGNILSLLADAFSKLPYYFIWKLHRGSVGMHLLCFGQSVSRNIYEETSLPCIHLQGSPDEGSRIVFASIKQPPLLSGHCPFPWGWGGL